MDNSTEQPERRKRIRLDAAMYFEPAAICSVTIAVQGRRPVFADHTIATAVVEMLRQRASATGVRVHAYSVMPDHVHLLLQPSAHCDIVTFVGQFKNLAQREAWRMGVVGSFWQKSFWDHFLRADEDLERAISYILNNAVAAGLASNWRDYPFAGSLVWDL